MKDDIILSISAAAFEPAEVASLMALCADLGLQIAKAGYGDIDLRRTPMTVGPLTVPEPSDIEPGLT